MSFFEFAFLVFIVGYAVIWLLLWDEVFIVIIKSVLTLCRIRHKVRRLIGLENQS